MRYSIQCLVFIICKIQSLKFIIIIIRQSVNAHISFIQANQIIPIVDFHPSLQQLPITNTITDQIMQLQTNTAQKFFLPGQPVTQQKLTFNPSNLYQNRNSQITALKFGQLTKKQKKTQNSQKTEYLDLLTFNYVYEPLKGDLVIGTIKMKSADYYIVDIGAPLDATLGALQFDGATKKNKPNVLQGSLIYCRVTESSKYLGAKLSCFNKGFNTKNDLGELKGGMKIQAPKYKHHLLESKLQMIAKYLKFEIAFGKNGFVWVKTQSLEAMIVLYNVVHQILQGATSELITQILQTAK